jgi:DNA-binding transcriptional LysR family regulator
MNLDELRALASVVEHGSFGAAAKTLRFPLATLRRRLDELEARMGVKLIERSHHGVVATAAGALLVDKARGVLSEIQSLRELVRGAGAEPGGEVGLALPLGVPPGLLTSFLNVMKDLYPRVSWRIRSVEDPVRAFTSEIHAALCFREKPPEGPWSVHPLLTMNERLVASRAYLDRHGTPTHVDQLKDHRLLLLEGPDRRGDVLPLADGSTFPVTPALRMNDVFLLRLYAARGGGIAFVPQARLPAAWQLGEEDVVPVLADVVGARLTVWLIASHAVFALPRMQMAFEQMAKLLSVLGD